MSDGGLWSRSWCFDWAQRLILAGLVVELLSLIGLYRSWGFMLFSMAGIGPLVAGVGLYLLGAIRPERGA